MVNDEDDERRDHFSLSDASVMDDAREEEPPWWGSPDSASDDSVRPGAGAGTGVGTMAAATGLTEGSCPISGAILSLSKECRDLVGMANWEEQTEKTRRI